MLPGRPNEGTKIKELRGTLRKDRHGDGPVAFTTVSEVDTPAMLSESAKKEWEVITSELIKAGVLQSVDLTILAAYCQEIADYWDLREILQDKGYTYETEKGYVGQRPEVAMMRKALEMATKIGIRFGVTPVGREKIRLRSNGPVKGDPVDDLL